MLKKIVISLLLLVYPSFAQVDFLLTGPSAESGAEYSAYVALPNTDPIGFYHNPAQLGFFAERNTLAISYPNYNNFGRLGDNNNRYATALSFSAGWVFKDIYKNINASLGLGYTRFQINLGNSSSNNNNGSSDSEDIYQLYNHIAVGLTFEYVLKASIGMGLKSISSNVENSENSSTISADFGIIISVPFSDLIKIYKGHNLCLNFGFAQMHSGKGLETSTSREPLPKESIAGYSTVYSFTEVKNNNALTWMSISYSSEAHNPLYAGTLTKRSNTIDFYKHVIKSHYEKDIQVNRTLKFNVYNSTFSYAIHRLIEDKNFGADNFSAHTFILSISKALSYSKNEIVKNVEDFDLRLSMTTSDKYGNSAIYGITLELSSIDIITDLMD